MTAADFDFLVSWEDMDVLTACSRWRVPAVEFHRTLGSTSDRGRELLRAGAPEWSLVIAEEQTEGRGRAGRPWHSPPGSGLWMSVVLRPPPSRGPTVLPILAGLAVAQSVEVLLPNARVGLKWPNDVLVDGAKVCGVLAEAMGGVGGGVVLGIGLNVRQGADGFPPDLDQAATSLALAGARSLDRGALVSGIVSRLRPFLEPWPAGLSGSILEEVARLDLLLGSPVRVTGAGMQGTGTGGEGDGGIDPGAAGTPEGTARGFDGVGEGIGPDGSLLVGVHGDAGRRSVTVRSGSVRLITGR